MSRNSYTPGPWFWESDVLCNVDFIVGGKHHQFNHRNRDLIAAAPELLEALQAMLNKAYKQNWNEQYPDEVEAAQAAIAKTLGQ